MDVGYTTGVLCAVVLYNKLLLLMSVLQLDRDGHTQRERERERESCE